MDLPMASICSLDDPGLRLQLERYRRAGRGARLLERTPRRVVAEFDQDVETPLIEETIALERECCAFFTLNWQPERRWLTIAVGEAEHERALGAIASALDVRSSD
ncbi:MAG TPA: hypothetical protein VGL51_15145 [Solirubrobacteraceae bacterium]